MGEMRSAEGFFLGNNPLAFRWSDCRLESLSDHSANESAMQNTVTIYKYALRKGVFEAVKGVKKQFGA